MKNLLTLMLVVLVVGLAGCKSKTTAPLTAGEDKGTVAQAVAAGHRVNLGLDVTRNGQISAQDLVEIRAQLHNATMSNIAAMKMLKDMNDAEEAQRMAAGLLDPPMTPEQKVARLAEIRKAMDDIRARELEVTKQKTEAAKASAELRSAEKKPGS